MLDLEHFEKAQRMSLTTQVELSLKGALITGVLKPGARLITKEIAERLGTSITPVREALLRLVSSGALHATPAQAFLVPEMTLDKYNEISTIRKTLEGMAVTAACDKMSDQKLNELRRLAESFEEAMRIGNVGDALNANKAFRFSLYDHAEMPTLTTFIEQLWVRIGPCFSCLYDGISKSEERGYRYGELLSALESGDSEACQKAIEKLIDEGTTILLEQYFS